MFKYDPPANLLQNKTILVTGASSGLGKATALAFASFGATVILHGKNVDKLETLYDEIEDAGYPQPAIIPLDLATATEADFQLLASSIENEFGKLDGIVHNAAIMPAMMPIQIAPLEEWQKVLQINLTSAFAICRSCLPLLEKGNNPSIIFTSSTAGKQAFAYSAAYCVSKHGLETLMQVLHQELENTSRIRVNSVNPGPFASALRKKTFPGEDQETLLKPEDLTDIYLYLMGNESLDKNGEQFSAQE